MADESKDLKDLLFNEEIVAGFAAVIAGAHRPFNERLFLQSVFDAGWFERSLMERMRHITNVLHQQLPVNYRQAATVLLAAVPVMEGGGFIGMVPCDYAAAYGLDDLETSIALLEEATKLTSAEFAVRPFILRYPEKMMAQMLIWAGHEHPAVRRLASEGCRPRLPWGVRLQNLVDDPRPILPILEKLKHDPEEAVRRSVANNLNDITKDHPEVVLKVLARWQKENDSSEDTNKITEHALRTLVKQGDSRALGLLGFPSEPQIAVSKVRVDPGKIAIGGEVTFYYELESTADRDQNLIVDYIVHLVRSKGQLSQKVYKHKKITIKPGQIIQIQKRHSFRQVTTRNYYPGRHAIQPQINGVPFDRVEFELVGS